MFSKSCEYAIRAVLIIGQNSTRESPVGVIEVAEAIHSPLAYTRKILQKLVKADIVGSSKGPGGGFYPIDFEKLKLKEVVYLMDGPDLTTRCGLGLKECNHEKPCPLHDFMIELRCKMDEMLNSKSIEEIVQDLDSKKIFLNR